MKPWYVITFFFAFALTVTFAQTSVNSVMPGKVGYSAFKLDKPEKVKITGNGGIYEDDWQTLVYYGWILNSETRKVVWHQIDVMDKMDLDYGKFDFSDQVSLEKGTYELYFTGAYVSRGNWSGDNILNIFTSRSETDQFKSNLPSSSFFNSWNKIKFKAAYLEELGITVSGVTRTDASDIVKAKTSDAILSILKPSRDANVKNGFTLSGNTNIRIYAIGEGRRNEQFDYAWITDLSTRKRVWEMDKFNTDYAGGDDKNVMFDGAITLPAGNYMLHYATDDSHHYGDWNAMPPNDPQFVGVTIWPASVKDKANIGSFKMPEEMKPVLEISHVRDDAFISQGLTVKSPVDLRILCLGELSDDEMVDGGWIIDARTREKVWDMNRERLEDAGGADKNKMFDGTITLEKGDYIVYYSTDDSHSYSDWNSGPPHEQEYWGITLWVTRKEDLPKVSTFDPKEFKSGAVIAEILQVRDNEYLSQGFDLTRDTKVRIVALGESASDELVDYAWIKNTDTDKTVWRMQYEETEHAGGDRKNRIVSEGIVLPKGSYKLYYRTDGSHSYRDWNARPPMDEEKYGVSVQMESN